MTRLVMVTGVGPGIGKTALASELAREYARVDFLVEDDYLLEREEFREVAQRFHRRVSPPPHLLEAAYEEWVRALDVNEATGVLDWAFVDLAEDLDWAETNFEALLAHLRACRALTARLHPRLFYLDGDPSIGLDRAEAERGRSWLERQADNLGLARGEWSQRRQELIAAYTTRRARVMKALRESSWHAELLEGDSSGSGVIAAARSLLGESA